MLINVSASLPEQKKLTTVQMCLNPRDTYLQPLTHFLFTEDQKNPSETRLSISQELYFLLCITPSLFSFWQATFSLHT